MKAFVSKGKSIDEEEKGINIKGMKTKPGEIVFVEIADRSEVFARHECLECTYLVVKVLE